MDNTLLQIINAWMAAEERAAQLLQENTLLRGQLLGSQKPAEQAPAEPAKDSA